MCPCGVASLSGDGTTVCAMLSAVGPETLNQEVIAVEVLHLFSGHLCPSGHLVLGGDQT